MTRLAAHLVSLALLAGAFRCAAAASQASPKTGAQPGRQLCLGHTGSVLTLRWSRDGKRAFTIGSDDTLVAWSRERGAPIASFPILSKQWDLSLDGSLLAAADEQGTIRIQDTATRRVLATVTAGWRPAEVHWSPDGRWLLARVGLRLLRWRSAQWSQPAQILSPFQNSPHKPRQSNDPGREIRDLSWSPNSRFVSFQLDDEVRLWGAGGAISSRLQLPKHYSARTLRWSPDGNCLAADLADRLFLWQPGHPALEVRGYQAGFQVSDGRNDYTLAWSPDGRRVALTSNQAEVRIFRRDGRPSGVLKEPEGRVHHFSWSPNGQRIATTSGEHLRLWDAESGRLSATLDAGDERADRNRMELDEPVWSPDGKTLAVTWLPRPWDGAAVWFGKPPIEIWNVEKAALARVLRGTPFPGSRLSWSPDGNLLASTGWSDVPALWDWRRGRPYAHLHRNTNAVQAVWWSPRGSMFAALSDDRRTLVTWDRDGDTPVAVIHANTGGWFGVEPYFNQVSWSRDGKRLAALTSSTNLSLWDPRSGREIAEARNAGLIASQLVWSPDGRRIATFGGVQVQVWDGENARQLQQFVCPVISCRDIQWSPDSRLLAVSDFQGNRTTVIADPEAGMVRQTLPPGYLSFQWSPAGGSLLIRSEKENALLWDATGGERRTALPVHGLGMAWSPQGNVVALADDDDNSIRLFDAGSGRERARLPIAGFAQGAVLWSPNGQRLATTIRDGVGELALWDPSTGRQIARLSATLEPSERWRWAPDSKLLASWGIRDVVLWDAATGRPRRRIHGPTAALTQDVSWSPDGRQLLLLGADGALSRFRASDGAWLGTSYSLANGDEWVALQPDGTIAGSAGGRALAGHYQ